MKGEERGGGRVDNDFSRVEISIAGGVEEMVHDGLCSRVRPYIPTPYAPRKTLRFHITHPGRTVRREPISKSCEITQADNLNRRRRLSRKAQ